MSNHEFKIYFFKDNLRISPFHNISIYPNILDKSIVNMVVEIPKNTRKKLEIHTKEEFNPLVYNKKNGKIREILYKNGYPENYGAIPQTWENPNIPDFYTGIKGDNDPLDCFDISNIKTVSGDVIEIKVLGCIAMIDQNEMDWKVIGINCKDILANKYKDIYDIPKSQLDDIVDFLKNYKIPEGKPKNIFYKKMIWSKNITLNIIQNKHEEWKKLRFSKL
jgi:inorganic pyrophosphatase